MEQGAFRLPVIEIGFWIFEYRGGHILHDWPAAAFEDDGDITAGNRHATDDANFAGLGSNGQIVRLRLASLQIRKPENRANTSSVVTLAMPQNAIRTGC